MKANELRIGNYLQSEILSIPKMQIESNGVAKMSGYGIHQIEIGAITNYKPIPLTEEWLLKFGFKPTPLYIQRGATSRDINKDFVHEKCFIRLNTWGYKDNDGKYIDDPEQLLFFNSETYYENCTMENVSAPLKYVHQLQNLFFALTGEELTNPH